jgi:putative protein kinase ArgK-like GTPase of G3E family
MNNTEPAILTPEANPPQAITQANPFAERANEIEAKPKKSSLLSKIIRNRRRRPVFAVLAGPPGIGKSTLLSMAPNVVFSPIERGLDSITVDKFPVIPSTLKEFRKQYMELLNDLYRNA